MASDLAPMPAADPALAALAVLTSFNEKNHEDVDSLLDVIQERELTMGLLQVSSYLTTILGNATGTTPAMALTHLRETVLQMVNDGQLGAEAFQIPPFAVTFPDEAAHMRDRQTLHPKSSTPIRKATPLVYRSV